ncbi:MAG: GIY-YIG nuclease family protein [Candidatus Aminicenantes bacterium]|jgi:DNA polymerase-3 subunit epsilon
MMKETNLLADLDVLFLDFQATAANPENGCLTEIGWLHWRATQSWQSVEPGIVSHLCQLPQGVEIPRRVTRITGLKTEDLNPGLPPGAIWEKLITTAGQIAADNQKGLCPTVIHFSRYEEPYLCHLHQQNTQQQSFPFDIVCTHQLSLRLLPGLPRKSLRAMAGYFGHSVPELRRSAHHIAATAFIWRHLVQLLAEKNIYTWDELKQWLKKTSSKIPAGGREYLLEASLRLNLPKKPGIYRMSRSNGDLLYIGKATSLKHRVNSYFQKGKRSPHANHIMEMLTQAAHLEVMVTGSALEAALLEADEIKRHSPPYNIALRQRDREIVFFSRDLREPSPQVDDSHPLGPFPTGKSIPTFATVDALLKGELTGMADTDICSLTLGIPPEYAPETECFWQGVEIFRQRHRQILKQYEGKFSIKGLMMLGKLLRQKQMEEMAMAETAESEEENGNEASETEETTWTPEGAADFMEAIIRHGAHLIRRSRWFCLLSEASLTWNTGKTSGENRRLLVLQGGAVLRREDIAPDAPIPSPPDFQKNFTARQQNFDLMTYDRLRVLTTELRRIAADETDRQVQLRLNPKVVLERQQLLNLLKWV